MIFFFFGFSIFRDIQIFYLACIDKSTEGGCSSGTYKIFFPLCLYPSILCLYLSNTVFPCSYMYICGTQMGTVLLTPEIQRLFLFILIFLSKHSKIPFCFFSLGFHMSPFLYTAVAVLYSGVSIFQVLYIPNSFVSCLSKRINKNINLSLFMFTLRAGLYVFFYQLFFFGEVLCV